MDDDNDFIKVLKENSIKIYICSFCQKQFPRRDTCLRHIRQRKRQCGRYVNYQCSKCNKDFKDKTKYAKHIQSYKCRDVVEKEKNEPKVNENETKIEGQVNNNVLISEKEYKAIIESYRTERDKNKKLRDKNDILKEYLKFFHSQNNGLQQRIDELNDSKAVKIYTTIEKNVEKNVEKNREKTGEKNIEKNIEKTGENAIETKVIDMNMYLDEGDDRNVNEDLPIPVPNTRANQRKKTPYHRINTLVNDSLPHMCQKDIENLYQYLLGLRIEEKVQDDVLLEFYHQVKEYVKDESKNSTNCNVLRLSKILELNRELYKKLVTQGCE